MPGEQQSRRKCEIALQHIRGVGQQEQRLLHGNAVIGPGHTLPSLVGFIDAGDPQPLTVHANGHGPVTEHLNPRMVERRDDGLDPVALLLRRSSIEPAQRVADKVAEPVKQPVAGYLLGVEGIAVIVVP